MIDKLSNADQLLNNNSNDITLFCHPMIVTKMLAKIYRVCEIKILKML